MPLVPVSSIPSLVASAPHAPGCYFWKERKSGGASKASDAAGTSSVATAPDRILYIGKAKDLRKRLSNYVQVLQTLQPGGFGKGDLKTQAMLQRATHVEWVETRTEVEALLLEARLIREHKPPYNIELKENVRYAWLKITDEAFPRIITVRNVGDVTVGDNGIGSKKTAKVAEHKKADLIGPFTDGSARFLLQTQARRLFKLRVCKTMPKKVCLYYHLGQCSGPCEGKISQVAYREDVERARLLLRGNAPQLIAELEANMVAASKELRFEEARRLRDTIGAVKGAAGQTGRNRLVAATKSYDEDVIVSQKIDAAVVFLVLHVRKGMITQADEFRVSLDRVDADAPLDEFVKTYYQQESGHPVPDELILERPLADDEIRSYLLQLKRSDVRLPDARLSVVSSLQLSPKSLSSSQSLEITVPKAGPKLALIDVARKNLKSRVDQAAAVLVALQDALRLPALPRRIDAFDNSHLQGTDLVSACVRFTDGKPDKAYYRRFIIKTVEGNDDFAAMREAVVRRYKRVSDLPDLILIDGGKGQLMAAYHALQEAGITDEPGTYRSSHSVTGDTAEDDDAEGYDGARRARLTVPIIGLAKREEEVFVPGLPAPLPIAPKSEPSLLLQRIRNEIHRFVITFHRERRGKRQVKSALDDIPSIGPAARAKLLVRFKSLDGVKKASDDDLRAVLSERQVQALRHAFVEMDDVSSENV
jgi:excinuclease ABC subunit C